MIDCGISSRPARSFRCRDEPEHVRLEHVLQEREPAGHVAVERGVADRELRLVPGRDDEPAELVRERHQQRRRATRAWRFSSVRSRVASPKLRRERLLERRRRSTRSGSRGSRSRGSRRAAARRRASPRTRSATASRPRAPAPAPSASTASAAVSAESIPPDSPTTMSRKPFLSHVVAQPELEREPHLLEVVLERSDGSCTGLTPDPGTVPARGRSTSVLQLVDRSASARRRTSAAAAPRIGRVDVDDEQRLLEPRCPRERLAVVVEHAPSGRRRSARPGRRPR